MAEAALNDRRGEIEAEHGDATLPQPRLVAERRQAEHPRGVGGWLMALLMRRMNAEQNRLTVQALRVRPGGAVLETGCGPGDALELVAGETPAGVIVGVDHSKLMVTMAARRNRVGVGTGRVVLHCADVAAMPLPDGRFDAAFAVNSYHQWEDRAAALREIRRTLKPGGRLVLSIRVLHEDRRWETAVQGRERVEAALSDLPQAGFRDIDAVEHRLGGRSVVLVSGVA